jgi:hypothetical protein
VTWHCSSQSLPYWVYFSQFFPEFASEGGLFAFSQEGLKRELARADSRTEQLELTTP